VRKYHCITLSKNEKEHQMMLPTLLRIYAPDPPESDATVVSCKKYVYWLGY